MYDSVGLLCCLLFPQPSDSASLLQPVFVTVAYHQSGCVPKVYRPVPGFDSSFDRANSRSAETRLVKSIDSGHTSPWGEEAIHPFTVQRVDRDERAARI